MASRSYSFAGPVSKAGWRKISRAMRPTGANFKFFSWSFADNLGHLFVAAQPKEGGMPHLLGSADEDSELQRQRREQAAR
jgi:hypothetical protein